MVYPVLTASIAVPHGISLKRQLVILVPYFFLVVALALERVRKGRNVLAVSMVALTFLSLAASYVQREIEDWRGPARLVQAQGQKDDVTLFHARYIQVAFDSYYQGAVPRITVSREAPALQLPEIEDQYRRVWAVFTSYDGEEDPGGEVRAWMDEHWSRQSAWTFTGVEIALYNTGTMRSIEGAGLVQ